MLYNHPMETVKSQAMQWMDALFRTGYPHPINAFVALLLTLIPLLSPFTEGLSARPTLSHGIAGLVGLVYLVIWSRLPIFVPGRPTRFFWLYTIAQTLLVSVIYALDGGLTSLLFAVVAVQAVYISPARRWGPYLGILAVLWITLYVAISPDPGSSMVAAIGMYISYLLFAAFVTFTMVQQERQNQVAQELLDGVDKRHHMLRAFESRLGHRTEMEERERLAATICATLLNRLSVLTADLEQLMTGAARLDAATVRAARLEAKDVLAAVRQAVRTLRPSEDGDPPDDDEEVRFTVPPEPEVAMKWTNPVSLYHVWNLLVIGITTGVVIAATLVAGRPQWLWLLLGGFGLLGAYWATALFRQPLVRPLALVVQAGLAIWIVRLSQEPMTAHLFVIIAAQMVFLVPPVNRWLAGSVVFSTLLAGAALWLTGLYSQTQAPMYTLTAAFAVTNFFGAVMAFMTRRQVEARERALLYANQLAEVNRLLEARLQEIRRIAIGAERVRMAREIHDGLGHHLTIVIMDLQYAEQLVDEDPAGALQHLVSAVKMIEQAMHTSREMVATLERFDRPLPVALSELVSTWRQGNPGVQVALRVSGNLGALSTAARITLFRTVQESLTNVQKHARAARVEITLTAMPDRVALTVSNNSAGEVPPVEAGRSGFGLIGLRERADELQGAFSAESVVDGGFEVKLVLPLGE